MFLCRLDKPFGLYLFNNFLAARFYYFPIFHDMDEIRRDFLQYSRVVSYQKKTCSVRSQLLDSFEYPIKRIYVDARIYLIQKSELWLQRGQLKHLALLFLAARHSGIDFSVQKLLVNTKTQRFLTHFF